VKFKSQARLYMKKFLLVVVCVFIFTLIPLGCTKNTTQEYGVFLGINEDEIEKLEPYNLVVIEPTEFSVEKINNLKSSGKTVYGYLNVGAVEEYRPYFSRFQDLYLGVYDDWPDERWVDVAASSWQEFITNELGKEYALMGFDGLFLDNFDVYYHYQTDEIFNSLCIILEGLKSYNLTLVINGGDTFVKRAIQEDKTSLFDGVNQETVFTSIDFENNSYGIQTPEETRYFKEYLTKVKNCGLKVYLLEYGASEKLSKKIDTYCKENGFIWYNAKDIELK